MHSGRPRRLPCMPDDQAFNPCRPACHSWEIPARRPSFNPLLPHACVASIERNVQKYHMAMQGDKVAGRAWRPPWSPGVHGDLLGRPESSGYPPDRFTYGFKDYFSEGGAWGYDFSFQEEDEALTTLPAPAAAGFQALMEPQQAYSAKKKKRRPTGDQASIIGGAINFVKELEQFSQTMEAHKRTTQQPEHNGHLSPFAEFFTFPQFFTHATSQCNNAADQPTAAAAASAESV
ncbi:putative RING/U-box superfamily protein [Hibiscus syriacus]|uniref:RING/U-box superfamily protein n=1 Tax=Hibiscus syriacus TaxID=106335 RepID=A0A6A3ARQ0_HIBSY|nr:putative RING/U-box superfamily protein [Hibiscus syriacus]